MITRRPSNERGHANHGWLDTYHSFSFANYYHPKHMGFRDLRVINEDRVRPGRGFGAHPHNDMEIVTYVLQGALEHKDSMGNGSVIHAGDVQRISAGTGITHSEYNPSQSEIVHFLQIWMTPQATGTKPTYEQRTFSIEEKRGRLCLIVSPDGRDESITVNQDVELYATVLTPGEQVTHNLKPNRYAWVQVIRGTVLLNDLSLEAGDGVAISEEELLEIQANTEAEALLFDLA